MENEPHRRKPPKIRWVCKIHKGRPSTDHSDSPNDLNTNFDVLLTVHLSIFILVNNQLDAQKLFYNKFISCLYMFRAPCDHRQGVKIVLYSFWYHTEKSEWSKITKITKITKIYKYEHIVVLLLCAHIYIF